MAKKQANLRNINPSVHIPTRVTERPRQAGVDRIFLAITLALVLVGLFVFTSASFGLFARKGFSFQNLFFDQIIGLFFGVAVSLVVLLRFSIKHLRTYALPLYLGGVIMTILVFVPSLGFMHGGAHRWLSFFGFSFQPSEFLKIGTVIYFAALLPLYKDRIREMKYMFGITFGVLIVPVMILVMEPDIGTLMVLLSAVAAMLIAGGARLRHLFFLFILCVVAVGVLAMVKPYVKARVMTFLDPSRDPQGASYQIQKSLIAIGSGGISGRGFGQSVQKFGSLPEPTGDSIFAVAGEEFGFIGGAGILILFFLFALRGLFIAQKAPDPFSGLLAAGIVILIISQSFANIAAMLGLIPLTGVPLVFISHGGTALLFAFLEVGILLNISRLPTKIETRRL